MDNAPPAPSKKAAALRVRPLLIAVLIVLTIIIIAAAARMRHQRRGGRWTAAGSTPAAAFPWCIAPGDVAHVRGHVDVYPGLPGLYNRCYRTPVSGMGPGESVPAPAAARQIESERPRIESACGKRLDKLTFVGAGNYTCAPLTGPGLGPTAAATDPSGGPALRSVSGAAHKLWLILGRAGCPRAGRAPALVGGRIEAYRSVTSPAPCGRREIAEPYPVTHESIRRLEDELSGAGPRAGWYVVIGGRLSCGGRAARSGFQAYRAADPMGGFPDVNPGSAFRDDREGFIGGAAPCTGPDRFGSRTHSSAQQDAAAAEGRELELIRRDDIYEGFSPDAPGTCAGGARGEQAAAKRELNALRVASGL